MANRRTFLKKLFQISAIGSGLSLAPSSGFAAFLKRQAIKMEIDPNDVIRFQDEAQMNIIQREIAKEPTPNLGLDKGILQIYRYFKNKFRSKNFFSAGERWSNVETNFQSFYKKMQKSNFSDFVINEKQVRNYFNNLPLELTAPCANLKLDDYNIIEHSQCFRTYSYYWYDRRKRTNIKVNKEKMFFFAKNYQDFTLEDDKDEYIMLHPSLNKMLTNKETYYCYGTPVGRPIIENCDSCREDYVIQHFCFLPTPDSCGEMFDTYPDEPIYRALISNAHCPSGKVHNNKGKVRNLYDCKATSKSQVKVQEVINTDIY